MASSNDDPNESLFQHAPPLFFLLWPPQGTSDTELKIQDKLQVSLSLSWHLRGSRLKESWLYPAKCHDVKLCPGLTNKPQVLDELFSQNVILKMWEQQQQFLSFLKSSCSKRFYPAVRKKWLVNRWSLSGEIPKFRQVRSEYLIYFWKWLQNFCYQYLI